MQMWCKIYKNEKYSLNLRVCQSRSTVYSLFYSGKDIVKSSNVIYIFDLVSFMIFFKNVIIEGRG